MTTMTLPRAQPANSGTDDGLHHLYCCDENVAMCGLDVTNYPETDGTDAPLCQLCAYVDDECLPCPAPGCSWRTA